MRFPRRHKVQATLGPQFDFSDRSRMGDFCALVDPSSGDRSEALIRDVPARAFAAFDFNGGVSNAQHVARVADYLVVVFGAAGARNETPGSGGAAAHGGTSS